MKYTMNFKEDNIHGIGLQRMCGKPACNWSRVSKASLQYNVNKDDYIKRNNDAPKNQCHPETEEKGHYTCKDLLDSH
jgi:hypothetical protein